MLISLKLRWVSLVLGIHRSAVSVAQERGYAGRHAIFPRRHSSILHGACLFDAEVMCSNLRRLVGILSCMKFARVVGMSPLVHHRTTPPHCRGALHGQGWTPQEHTTCEDRQHIFRFKLIVEVKIQYNPINCLHGLLSRP